MMVNRPLHMHDFDLHDPFVLSDVHGGQYYVYNANYFQYRTPAHGGGKSIVMYSSTDLRSFSEPKNVFDLSHIPLGAWYDDSDSPWAPEVHQWHGRYWMFMTLHAAREQGVHPAAGPEWYVRNGMNHHRRGVFVAVADDPSGPFAIEHPGRPTSPESIMALDGTLVVDRDGSPWMIYAHEWVELFDGSMEAIRLDPDDLSRSIGDPVHLWDASEGAWHKSDGDAPANGWRGDFSGEQAAVMLPEGASGYVTDGPYAMRAPNGSLACLWTSYSTGEYVLTQAISHTGAVEGPWEQLAPLDRRDAGHAMVFRAFDGTLLLMMHTNMTRKGEHGRPLHSHGIVYEVELGDRGFRLGAHRADLDGIVNPDDDR